MQKEQVTATIQSFCAAFNEGNAKKVAALFLENAEFVNIFGMRLSGRKQIEEGHTFAFNTLLKTSQIIMPDISINLLKPDVAYCLVAWKREAGDPSGLPPGKGFFSMVLECKNEEWKFVVAHNTESVAVPRK